MAGIREELEKIKTQGVEEAELRRVKAQVLASQVYQQDSLFYQGMLIGEWETAGLDYRDRDLRFEKLKQVTSDQIRDVAARYLVDDRLTMARLEPLPVDASKPLKRGFAGGAHVR